jgi:nucleotide-binding universal stress UspA family protein
MKQPTKILACVDQSPYATSVADYSAWVAKKLSLPLELLHIIDRHQETATSSDRSGAIGVDAQETLLNQLTEQEGKYFRAVREQGRIFLHDLKLRCETSGTQNVDTRQRYGQLLDALEEQQSHVGLYVLGRRGESAAHSGRDLGRHVEAISRRIRRPILTVAGEFKEPKTALVAFDGKRMTRRCIELIANTPALNDIPFHVVMAGKTGSDNDKHLAWAQQLLAASGFQVETAQLSGDPELAVTQAIQERAADILFMGAYSRSALSSFFFGSKTNDLLRASQVPTVTVHL